MSLVHIDWAQDGLMYALKNRDIVVVVDTLRFSSAVVTAVAHGFSIYPVPDRQHGEKLSETVDACMAGRSDEPGISISPVSFVNVPVDHSRNVILPSPNGATCSAMINAEDCALVGCFLNAQAAGEMLTSLAYSKGRNVTVIACGEQRSVVTGQRVVYVPEDAHRVFAIEDYLGAGAIIVNTSLQRSAEAEICARSFMAAENDLSALVRDSFSGRYLIEHDMVADIDHAVQINRYTIVPSIHGGDVVWID
jgi:2-phosphosulfolactate phosphatase